MKLVKLMAVNSFYRIANLLAAFLITVLLSRLTGAVGYGLFSLMIANATFLNLVLSLGTEASLAYHSASNLFKPNMLFKILWTVVLFQLMATLIVEGVFHYFTRYFFILKVEDISTAIIGIIFLLSLSIGEKFMFLLNGAQLFSLCNRIILAYNSISLVVFLFLTLSKRNDDAFLCFKWYVTLHAFQTVTMATMWCKRNWKQLFYKSPITKKWASIFFNYSSVAFVTNIIQFAAYRTDLWFVNMYYGSSKELGWYSLAVRLSQFYLLIPGILASIVLVTTAQNKKHYPKESIHVILRLLNTAGFFVLLFFSVSSWWLITAIFGVSYKEATYLFLIHATGSFLFCNSIILSSYFAGIRQLKTNLKGSVLCLLLVASLAFILVPLWGSTGAAIAASFSVIITSAYFVSIYCSKHEVSVSELFILRKTDLASITPLIKELIKK